MNLRDVQNLYNPLEGKMGKAKEYFIQFFGEQYRSQIEDRFSRTHSIFYDRNEQKNNRDRKSSYFDKLAIDELNSCNQSYEGFMVFPVKTLEPMLTHLKNLKKWTDKIDKEDYAFVNDFLSNIFFDKTITEEDDVESILKDEEKSRLFYRAIKSIYENFDKNQRKNVSKILIEKEQKTFLYWPELKELEKSFKTDCQEYLMFNILNDFKLPLTDENLTLVNKISKDIFKVWTNGDLSNCYNENIYKRAIETISNVTNFPIYKSFQETERKLESLHPEIDEKLSQYLKTSYDIKTGVKQFQKDFGGQIDPEIEKEIKVHLASMHFGFTGAFEVPLSIQENSDNLVVYSSSDNTSEHEIVHELSHAAQSLIKVDNETGIKVLKNGVAVLIMFTGGEQEDVSAFNNLNEVINDWFSFKIEKLMEKDDFRIGYGGDLIDLSELSPITTNYQWAFPFMSDFLNKNLNVIKDVCMSEYEDNVIDAFGGENLVELDKLIGKIFELYGNEKDMKDNIKLLLELKELFDGKKSIADYRLNELSELAKEYLSLNDKFAVIFKNIEKYQNGEIISSYDEERE